jgi:hypothetical protein
MKIMKVMNMCFVFVVVVVVVVDDDDDDDDDHDIFLTVYLHSGCMTKLSCFIRITR